MGNFPIYNYSTVITHEVFSSLHVKHRLFIVKTTERFLPPSPPINFEHGSHMERMNIIGHVAAATSLSQPRHSAP